MAIDSKLSKALADLKAREANKVASSASTYCYALLSLDLKEHSAGKPVESSERKIFNEKLGEKWNKISEIGTVWWIKFPDPMTQEAILARAKIRVEEAAALAKIKNYEVVVVGTNSKPIADIFTNP